MTLTTALQKGANRCGTMQSRVRDTLWRWAAMRAVCCSPFATDTDRTTCPGMQVPRFAAPRLAGSRAPDHVVRAATAELPFCDSEYGVPYASISTTLQTTSRKYSSAFNALPRFPPPRRALESSVVTRANTHSGWATEGTHTDFTGLAKVPRWNPTKMDSTGKQRGPLYMGKSSERFGKDQGGSTSPRHVGPRAYRRCV